MRVHLYSEIKYKLKDIGITVNLEMVEWATWLSDVYTNRKYVASLAGLAGAGFDGFAGSGFTEGMIFS